MSDHNSSGTGRLALALAACGLVLGVLIAIVGSLFDRNWTMPGYGVFAGFQLFAIILGAMSFKTTTGRTAAIGSGILLAVSILFLG